MPGNLTEFRNDLRKSLGKDFESIYEYEFNINITPEFKTCKEGAWDRKLPVLHGDKDVNDFFKKFKFIVNYPNRFGINDLLKNELQKKLKKLDGEVYNSLYYHKLHNWMAKRIGTFYTRDNSYKLFEEIEKNLLPWTMDGLNISYFANVYEEYKFEEYEPLDDFLKTEQKVFHLVFQDIRLGRMRIVQTFEKLKENDVEEIRRYTRGFGYIFSQFAAIVSSRFS